MFVRAIFGLDNGQTFIIWWPKAALFFCCLNEPSILAKLRRRVVIGIETPFS